MATTKPPRAATTKSTTQASRKGRAAPPQAKAGRPSTYTPEAAADVLDHLVSGHSLKAACRLVGADEGTVRTWVRDDREGFATRYTRAREIGCYAMVDEILDIADDTSNDTITTAQGRSQNTDWINRSRLKVETRKWLASKILPKVFGDKNTIEHTGPDGGPVIDLSKCTAEQLGVLRSIVKSQGQKAAPSNDENHPDGDDNVG